MTPKQMRKVSLYLEYIAFRMQKWAEEEEKRLERRKDHCRKVAKTKAKKGKK